MGDFPRPFSNNKVKKDKKPKFTGFMPGLAEEAKVTQTANNLIDDYRRKRANNLFDGKNLRQFGEAIFEEAVTAPPINMVGQTMQNAMMSGNANPAMSNMPPQPSNVMGVAQPVFDPRSMAAASNIYGDQQMRQNAVNAPNVFAAPFQQKEDFEKIIGEQTFELEKDKPSGNYVAGLSLDGGSADPMDTSDRIVLTREQKKEMKAKGLINDNFIDQMEEMNIKKDSMSGGKNFYSIKKPMIKDIPK